MFFSSPACVLNTSLFHRCNEAGKLPFNLSITYSRDLLSFWCLFLHGLCRQTNSGSKLIYPCIHATWGCIVCSVFLSSVSNSIPTLLTKWYSDFHQLTTMQTGEDGTESEARLTGKQMHVLKWCIVYALWITCTCVINSLEIALVLM